MATADISLVTTGKLDVHGEKVNVRAQVDATANVAIVAGQPIALIASTGKWALADANTQATRDQIYVALNPAVVGGNVTGSKSCVASGFDLSLAAYGCPIYLSDTEGAWSRASPSTGTAFICGMVVPVPGSAAGVSPDKAIRFCTL